MFIRHIYKLIIISFGNKCKNLEYIICVFSVFKCCMFSCLASSFWLEPYTAASTCDQSPVCSLCWHLVQMQWPPTNSPNMPNHIRTLFMQFGLILPNWQHVARKLMIENMGLMYNSSRRILIFWIILFKNLESPNFDTLVVVDSFKFNHSSYIFVYYYTFLL